jgi:hypothetical protein
VKALTALMAGSFALAACGRPQGQIPADWTGKRSAEQRAILDRLADNCGLPHDFFRLEGGHLTIQPHPNEKYERIDCALGALKGIRGMPKLGFVGNEYYVGNEQ